ncbi:MAG: hypothetical protein ACTHOB_17295 [Ginsengibacter sp.]
MTILNLAVGEAIALRPALNSNCGEQRNGRPTVAKDKGYTD